MCLYKGFAVVAATEKSPSAWVKRKFFTRIWNPWKYFVRIAQIIYSYPLYEMTAQAHKHLLLHKDGRTKKITLKTWKQNLRLNSYKTWEILPPVKGSRKDGLKLKSFCPEFCNINSTICCRYARGRFSFRSHLSAASYGLSAKQETILGINKLKHLLVVALGSNTVQVPDRL